MRAARKGGAGADDWRFVVLADKCADLFSPDGSPPANTLSSFALAVLGGESDSRSLEWKFAAHMCRARLANMKKAGEDESAVTDALTLLLGHTRDKVRLLFTIYSNPHPSSNGMLTGAELACILAHEEAFPEPDLFDLLGVFAAIDPEVVRIRSEHQFKRMCEQPTEARNCMARFISSAHLAALRYGWKADQWPTVWIIDTIMRFRLDGVLLGMYDLAWFRDRGGGRLRMAMLVSLVRSRIDLEGLPRPYETFEFVPHDWEIKKWCEFDHSGADDVTAFQDFCRLSLMDGFIAHYWVPNYVAQLDASGRLVAEFVEQSIREKPDITVQELARLSGLASAYPDDSDAWSAISRPICAKVAALPQPERVRVYCGLSPRSTQVFSCTPGQVPDYFVQARDKAQRLLSSEPIGSPLLEVREWKVRCCEADLRREEEQAEEVSHG